MEAGFDQIQAEEHHTAVAGRLEDAEEERKGATRV